MAQSLAENQRDALRPEALLLEWPPRSRFRYFQPLYPPGFQDTARERPSANLPINGAGTYTDRAKAAPEGLLFADKSHGMSVGFETRT